MIEENGGGGCSDGGGGGGAAGVGGPEGEAAGCPGRHQGEDGQSRVTMSFVRSGGWREW